MPRQLLHMRFSKHPLLPVPRGLLRHSAQDARVACGGQGCANEGKSCVWEPTRVDEDLRQHDEQVAGVCQQAVPRRWHLPCQPPQEQRPLLVCRSQASAIRAPLA